MAITTINEVGALTQDIVNQLNDNFASLSSSTAGGTLTDAHLLIGDANDVATDTAVTGDVTIDNAGVTAIGAGKVTNAMLATAIRNPTIGVAAGYKIARVEQALDGSNPTSWATGLTTIVAANVSLKGAAAPGVGTSVLTCNINGTSLDVYAWKVTATGDCTLIASTGTESFYGIAIGT